MISDGSTDDSGVFLYYTERPWVNITDNPDAVFIYNHSENPSTQCKHYTFIAELPTQICTDNRYCVRSESFAKIYEN